MFGRRHRPAPTAAPARPALPDSCVVWAIGDIHGRADLLRPLVEEMLADLARSPAARRVLVFLGDYVDRGPQSAQVLDILSDLSIRPGLETWFLRGNHEDRLLAFLGDPEIGRVWSEYGGRETLSSFGVQPPSTRADTSSWQEASRALGDALPLAHSQFLAGLGLSVSIGDYFFSHAGARPGVDLEDQAPEDLMWIRHEFLQSRSSFARVVVHGHTPSAFVHSDTRRIGIDTGAYATGVLTGLRLEKEDRLILQASSENGAIVLRRKGL